MNRRIWIGLVAGLALVTVSVVTVRAAVPTGCTFPATADNFGSMAEGDSVNPPLMNRLFCAINKIELRLLATPVPQITCSSITVPAATRQQVTLTVVTALSGNEAVFPSVRDGTSLSLLSSDGVQSASGTSIVLWVFNRDAAASRTGTVCAQAVRAS